MSCLDLPPPPQKNVPIILVVAAAIIDSDNRVLIARRPEGKAMAGLWEFPGGKVKDGEGPELALIRELKEELNITAGWFCLHPLGFASHPYDDFHLLMPLYAVRQWAGDIQAIEHTDIKFVPATDLPLYAMPPADLPLIAVLRDYLVGGQHAV